SLLLPTCLASGSTLCTAEGHPVASCSTWIQIRTLGPLIAVALAGSSLSAETAPTPHSNRAAPISAELASPRRAVHWRSRHTPRNQRVAGLPLDRLNGTISKSA